MMQRYSEIAASARARRSAINEEHQITPPDTERLPQSVRCNARPVAGLTTTSFHNVSFNPSWMLRGRLIAFVAWPNTRSPVTVRSEPNCGVLNVH